MDNKDQEIFINKAIAVFAKTPGISKVKTRLAADIGEDLAEDIYRQSVQATATVLKAMNDTHVIWALAEAESETQKSFWSRYPFPAFWTGPGNLGHRLHAVYSSLIPSNEKVLLIGTDSPQIASGILDDAFNALEEADFVIGPAKDGGFYLFGGRRTLDPQIWTSVEYSRNDTREMLIRRLPSRPKTLHTLCDLDVITDIPHVIQEFPDDLTEDQAVLKKYLGRVIAA